MQHDKAKLFEDVKTQLLECPRSSLTSIASNLGVDRHTIRRAVQSATGLSFRKYQKRAILQLTRTLLRQTDRSIKEIAFSLGYRWPRDFSRFVKKATGKTPTQWRRQLLAGEDI